MELLKKNIHMNWQKGKAEQRMSLSEDFNIPDKKPDAGRLIQKRGFVRMEEIRTTDGQVQMKGSLEIQMLYLSEGEEHSLHRLTAKFPFEEKMQMEGLTAGETVEVRPNLEDLKVRLINSRKFSIQALLSFEGILEELYDVQAGVEIHGGEGISVRKKELSPLSLSVRTRDIVRVKEELSLSSSKPNIREILWDGVELRGTDIRVLDGELDVRGELSIFLLYEADGEKESREWMEASLPFQQKVACQGSRSDHIPDVDIRLNSVQLEAVPDYDGEERLIQAEAVLGLNIRLYEEETVEILDDVYSPEKDLVPVKKEETYESLVIRNFSKCRASDRVKMEADAPRMLQFCHSQGEVVIDDTQITPQGIRVEGSVHVTILYVTSDDGLPFAIMQGDIPFQHLIEVEGLNPNCRFSLNTGLEQLSAVMIDSEEIEIKVSVNLHAFVAEEHRCGCVEEIQEKELDLKKLQELPGIVGYLVQPGDTMWEIAKAARTTPEKIREWNHLETAEPLPGSRLLLLKSLPKIR
jgi:hypothetical protein